MSKQTAIQKNLNKIKMVHDLKSNETFLEILSDFRLAKISSMTIVEKQIETEKELASYWLNEYLKKQYKL
jgi:hypothetical protein